MEGRDGGALGHEGEESDGVDVDGDGDLEDLVRVCPAARPRGVVRDGGGPTAEEGGGGTAGRRGEYSRTLPTITSGGGMWGGMIFAMVYQII